MNNFFSKTHILKIFSRARNCPGNVHNSPGRDFVPRSTFSSADTTFSCLGATLQRQRHIFIQTTNLSRVVSRFVQHGGRIAVTIFISGRGQNDQSLSEIKRLPNPHISGDDNYYLSRSRSRLDFFMPISPTSRPIKRSDSFLRDRNFFTPDNSATATIFYNIVVCIVSRQWRRRVLHD